MPLNNSQIEDAFSATDEDIQSLLSNILNLNLGNDSSEKVVIGTINKLLSVSKSRLQGLEFLNLIVNNCSPTVISENALTWISHCVVKYPGDNLKEIKLSTIGKIIENVYGEQEFTKKFVSDYISKVLENCLLSAPANAHESEAALETISICMKYYGSWFAPHKLKIESFLLNFLENSSEKLVEKAAACFHYLQQIGGAGADGINHRTNFSVTFGKLCATVQKLFDTFFENVTEIDHSTRSDQDGFDFTDLPHYSQKMLHITARRIRNCLKFITTMLLKSFPVAKELKPIEVLDIIHRGTAVHQCLSMGNEKSLEDFQFSLLLNKIQIQLLQLLRIFIIWGQTNLLPFSSSISKTLIDYLNKSQNCYCFKTDNVYQEVVYKVLGCWLRISKNTVHVHYQTQLVNCILKDITPVTNPVTLSLQSDTPKHKSTKAKRKAIQERIISSGQNITSTENLRAVVKHYKEKTCLSALTTLKHLLCSTTLRVNANVLQDLYKSVISTMMDIQTSKVSHPYTNNDCQAKLYEVFVAFYEQDTLKTLPPLQLTLDVLSKGVNNKNRHIALTCELGLSILEKLCQPVCPSMFSPKILMSKEIIKEPEPIFNNSVLNEINNEIENANQNEETEEGIEQILQIVNQNDEETEPEVNLEEAKMEVLIDANQVEAPTEDTPDTLQNGKTVHILDVKVIKTTTTGEEVSESINIVDSTVKDTDVPGDGSSMDAEVGSYHTDDYTNEVDILKTEILSNISIVEEKPRAPLDDIGPPDNGSEMNGADEPPTKKCKIVIELEDYAAVDIKEEPTEEPKTLEEVDDRFEEDDAFVDVVKEY